MHTQFFVPVPESKSSTLTFTCFSKLPLEIREQVWLDARPLRVVRVHQELVGSSCNGRQVITRVFLEAIPVAIMQTCSEARKVCLGIYTKIYPKGKSDYIYIDFSHDTLYFEYSLPPLGCAMCFFDTHKIQSLAIDIRYRNPHFTQEEFTQLRELIFVAQPPVPRLKPMGKTSIILKDIGADYEREVRHGYFADVFEIVLQRFFVGFAPIRRRTVWGQCALGPCTLVSLMVDERVQCDHITLWDFGYALSSRGQGACWSHTVIVEDPEL